ncbi:hypothetical protein MEG_00985 [Bartonella tamiae Th307]|uniref:Bestrophin n=2 Tax=Bartonella tamiae TaxID=373638 RepID=J1K0G4_9HYPH|nr:hypothetical protein ME5_00896 [Bartonella tamiae Th239]EJF93561.1 hypothetical protein MEG_00985 [Bartonella tamiae Th307]
MIIRPRPHIFKLFFVMQGSILPKIAPQLIAIFLLSVTVVLAHYFFPNIVPTYNSASAFTMLGIALSVFLGFRNNACYDRWWEGRIIWGKIVSSSRDLIRQTYLFSDRINERHAFLYLTSAFSFSLAYDLKNSKAIPEALLELNFKINDEYLKTHNKPSFILNCLAQKLVALYKKKLITDIQFQMIDKTLERLNESQVACERLKTTPVPFPYTLLLHRTAYIFCFLIPFGFNDILGWWTPVASLFVAYTLFGLDAISEEMEQPFAPVKNALPICAMATLVARDIYAQTGKKMPEAIEPINYVLQ